MIRRIFCSALLCHALIQGGTAFALEPGLPIWTYPSECPEASSASERARSLADQCAGGGGGARVQAGFHDRDVSTGERSTAPPQQGALGDACEALDGAVSGDVEGMLAAAAWMRRREGGGRDLCAAARWTFAAANAGDVSAMTLLGAHFETGSGAPKDLVAARRWYEKAAEQDDARALTRLGALYRDGKGVKQDLAKSVEFFTFAADRGEPVAMMQLAEAHLKGVGVKASMKLALKWSRRAADTGHPPAMAQVSALLLWGGLLSSAEGGADCAEGLTWARKAEKAGVPVAASLIGDAYRLGCGVSADVETARDWYRKALQKGAPMTADSRRAAEAKPADKPAPDLETEASVDAEATSVASVSSDED